MKMIVPRTVYTIHQIEKLSPAEFSRTEAEITHAFTGDFVFSFICDNGDFIRTVTQNGKIKK